MAKIPSRLGRLIEEYIRIKTGKKVIDQKTLEKIRQSVIAQKSGYWKPEPIGKYVKGYDVFAYLAYQAPGYLIQFRYILKKLERDGMLTDDISLLDLGTGPGIVPLAFIWHQKERKTGSLKLNVIEQSEEFLSAFQYLVRGFISETPNISLGLIKCGNILDISPDLPDNLTLITFQNVFSELIYLSVNECADIVMKYSELLSDKGFLIIIEPAELRHSTRLRELQVVLMQSGLFIYAPCKYIWRNKCNPENCWSFCSLPNIEPPHLMQLLAGEKNGYRFLNTDIKFSYLICSKTDRSDDICSNIRKDKIPLANLGSLHGIHVKVIVSKMSGDIGDRDYAIFFVCDGTGLKKTYLVIPRALSNNNVSNAFFADYGDILENIWGSGSLEP